MKNIFVVSLILVLILGGVGIWYFSQKSTKAEEIEISEGVEGDTALDQDIPTGNRQEYKDLGLSIIFPEGWKILDRTYEGTSTDDEIYYTFTDGITQITFQKNPEGGFALEAEDEYTENTKTTWSSKKIKLIGKDRFLNDYYISGELYTSGKFSKTFLGNITVSDKEPKGDLTPEELTLKLGDNNYSIFLRYNDPEKIDIDAYLEKNNSKINSIRLEFQKILNSIQVL